MKTTSTTILFGLAVSVALQQLAAKNTTIEWPVQDKAIQDKTVGAEDRRSKALSALCAAIDSNANYCQEWNDAEDFESLAKTTHGIALIAELLIAESEDPGWRKQLAELKSQTQSLLQAASADDKTAANTAIENIRKLSVELTTARPELVESPRYSQRNDIGRTMDLLDGTYADAKAALLFDEVEEAKREAFVLWKLGEYLRSQGSRGTTAARWLELADGFSQAALRAGELDDPNSDALRSALKLAHDQCEKCHNRE